MPDITEFKIGIDGSTTTEYSDGSVKVGSLSTLTSGTISHALALSGSVQGVHQEVRVLLDGPSIGQRVQWWKPSTQTGFWGYDISPSDRYTG